MARAMPCDPPSATGQPYVCAAVPRATPIAEDSRVSRGLNECAAAPAKRARASSVRHSRATHDAGGPATQTEHPELQDVLGDAQHRAQEVLGDVGEVRCQRAEDLRPPRPVIEQMPCGRGDVLPDRCPAAAVQRVGELDVRSGPAQTVLRQVDGPGECIVDRERMEPRAFVVEQSGDGELRGSRATAHLVSGFQNSDVDPVPGEGHGGGETVGSASDHDRLHRSTDPHASRMRASSTARSIVLGLLIHTHPAPCLCLPSWDSSSSARGAPCSP